MNIGIIGAGNIAGTLGVLWSRAGHVIRFGTRHPEQLGELLARAGTSASAGTPEEAAAFGEVVFCSVPFGAWPELASRLLPHLKGKTVLDSANPYPQRDGAFAEDAIAAGKDAGVPVAALLPGVRLVRAFNSVYYKTLETEERVGIPLASDNPAAIETAAGLVRDAGFDPIPVGPLERARDFDPGQPVYTTGMSGPALLAALGVTHRRKSGDGA